MLKAPKLQYFAFESKISENDFKGLRELQLNPTKFPNDFDTFNFLNNVRYFTNEVEKFMLDWELKEDDSTTTTSNVAKEYSNVIEAIAKRHETFNQQTVKLDYYRSKIDVIRNNTNLIRSYSSDFSKKIESITNFRLNLDTLIEAESNQFQNALKNTALNKFFDFKFDVDLEQHHLHFILKNGSDLIYLKCRFLQKYEPKMIYTILDVFYRQQQSKIQFNCKQFIELANSKSDTFKFFL